MEGQGLIQIGEDTGLLKDPALLSHIRSQSGDQFCLLLTFGHFLGNFFTEGDPENILPRCTFSCICPESGCDVRDWQAHCQICWRLGLQMRKSSNYSPAVLPPVNSSLVIRLLVVAVAVFAGAQSGRVLANAAMSAASLGFNPVGFHRGYVTVIDSTNGTHIQPSSQVVTASYDEASSGQFPDLVSGQLWALLAGDDIALRMRPTNQGDDSFMQVRVKHYNDQTDEYREPVLLRCRCELTGLEGVDSYTITYRALASGEARWEARYDCPIGGWAVNQSIDTFCAFPWKEGESPNATTTSIFAVDFNEYSDTDPGSEQQEFADTTAPFPSYTKTHVVTGVTGNYSHFVYTQIRVQLESTITSEGGDGSSIFLAETIFWTLKDWEWNIELQVP